MILLADETKELIKKLEGEIEKSRIKKNWKELMKFTPIPSGSPQEEQAIKYMKKSLEESGLECKIHRFEAYISTPIRRHDRP